MSEFDIQRFKKGRRTNAKIYDIQMLNGKELQHKRGTLFISQNLLELSSGTDKMFARANCMNYLWSNLVSVYVTSRQGNFSINLI